MISSTHNPKIKQIKALLAYPNKRREMNAFVVEGVRLIEECIKTGWDIELLLFSNGLDARGMKAVEACSVKGYSVEEVTESIMQAVSDTQAPQGLLAIVPIHELPMPKSLGLVLIPDGVRDPGNLGTILRTATAAGVDALWLTPGTADIYAPKIVRAAMGAHFRLPLVVQDWDEIGQNITINNLRLILADATLGIPYTQANFCRPLALVIGGEAEGPSERAKKLCHEWVHIPMPGGTESMNAAVAAGILLFEVVRQRMQKGSLNI